MAVRGVDSHAHVFVKGLPLAARRRHAPEYDATIAQWLAHLDACGLSHGVLVQPSFLGTDNHHMLAAMAPHRQRMHCVGMLDPTIDEPVLERLDAQGMVGVRLNLVGLDLPDLTTPTWQAFLARMRDLDWHLELHREGHDLPGLLSAIAPSGCRVVLDHFGRPGADQAADASTFIDLVRAAQAGRVWFKLSAAYRSARRSLTPRDARDHGLAAADAELARARATRLLETMGPERLVWGSDWPHTQHEDLIDFGGSLAQLEDWIPNDAQRRQVLAQTPAELFHFGPPAGD